VGDILYIVQRLFLLYGDNCGGSEEQLLQQIVFKGSRQVFANILMARAGYFCRNWRKYVTNLQPLASASTSLKRFRSPRYRITLPQNRPLVARICANI
jgi:hypothetical protein